MWPHHFDKHAAAWFTHSWRYRAVCIVVSADMLHCDQSSHKPVRRTGSMLHIQCLDKQGVYQPSRTPPPPPPTKCTCISCTFCRHVMVLCSQDRHYIHTARRQHSAKSIITQPRGFTPSCPQDCLVDARAYVERLTAPFSSSFSSYMPEWQQMHEVRQQHIGDVLIAQSTA